MIQLSTLLALLLSLCSVISYAQITFEKTLPFWNVTCGGQASDGNYFLTVGVGTEVYLVKYNEAGKELSRKELNTPPLSIHVSSNEVIIVFDIHVPNQPEEQLSVMRLDHDMNLISSWDYSFNGYFSKCFIQKTVDGNYVLFYARTIVPNGTYNDFRLFFLAIDNSGQVIEEKQLQGNFSAEAVGMSMSTDNYFYLFGNEFEYTTTTNIYGRVTRISPQRNVMFDYLLPDVILVNGFAHENGVDVVGQEVNNLNVYHINETATTITKTQVGQTFNFNFTLPDFVEQDDKGLVILGRSNGVELPEGFFILRTDNNYSIVDTISFYRGRPGSRLNGLIKSRDKGFFTYGVIDPPSEIVAYKPVAYVMKFDSLLSTGYRPSFLVSTVATGLQSDIPLYWLDYNNDGEQDMITINYEKLRLYRNNGKGQSFQEVTGVLPLVTDGNAVSIADYDNDGFLDIYICTGYSMPGKNILLRNKGNGTFESIINSGLTDDVSRTRKAQWLDFNLDGYLDLFVADGYPFDAPPKLYINNGNSIFKRMFTDVITSGNTWMDLNNDFYPDLIHIGSYEQMVYINNQGKEITKKQFTDYFEDGTIPQFVGTLFEWGTVSYNENRQPSQIMLIGSNADYVYRLNQNGKYTSEGMPSDLVYDNDPDGFEQIDLNNDQLGDFFFNGSGSSYTNIKEILFNRADSENSYTFMRELQEGKRTFDHFSWLDVDHDGYLDLLGSRGDHVELLKNAPANNKWVAFQLEGTSSTSNGSGAFVKIKTGARWQTKIVTTQAGLNGQLGNYIHFGVGKALSIDSVAVFWPSGCKQFLKNVNTNTLISLNETCSGENPTLTWNKNICELQPLNIEITSNGDKFHWFASSTNEFPLGESGKNLQIDSLTRDIVLFVANADSAIISRKIPVQVKVYPKPDFTIAHDSINSTTYKFSASSSRGIETYQWSYNEKAFSDAAQPFLELTESGVYKICLVGANPGCELKVCSDILLLVTGIEEILTEGYETFPNPVTTSITVRDKHHDDFDLWIISADGRTMFKGFQKDSYEITMTDYPSGLYTVVMKSKNSNGKRTFFKVAKR